MSEAANLAALGRWVPLSVRAATGLAQLALRGGREISDLVAEMHSVIARSPWMFSRRVKPDARRAPLPYRIVGGSFSALATLVDALPSAEIPHEPDGWRRFVGALNGVMGDKLAAWNNTLAIGMSVRQADGSASVITRAPDASHTSLVLFVHGLCCCELEWQTPAHRRFVAELQDSGRAVAWLRYNSGRAICDNGRELADLLEAHLRAAAPEQRLILIGHSMGGLVIRSACHHASQQRYQWMTRLTHAAYLGSPHHGAPLERAGNVANAVLGLTPYSAAFMRLGNIRSRGIKDLRFGCVSAAESANLADDSFEDHRASAVPLAAHVKHLMLAGSLEARPGGDWIGDGLVPVASALGQHREARMRLVAPHLQRLNFESLGHVAMLGDERVYDSLKGWLAPPSSAATSRAGNRQSARRRTRLSPSIPRSE
jgi:pimeloyl-ACP methyl ester carboxylesterase